MNKLSPKSFISTSPPHYLFHLHQELKETIVNSLGQGISGGLRLLHIESLVDHLVAPDVHDPAGQFGLQVGHVDRQEMGGEVKTWEIFF